ncbi:MAG TPA: glycosyltransferase family 2 protein [Chthoniobacterales bacterium]|nr:glycosyltransferase family 2 protein [Chthoniobacterales bacterium]
MKISIITPCLNSVPFIGGTIESVISQGYPDVEHWIIDGGSSDGTLDLLKRHQHVRIVSEPDRGVYDAINKGIRLATGEVIIFLNSGDFLGFGALALSAEIFRNAIGTMIVSAGCQIFRCTPDGSEIEMYRYDNPRQYALSLRNVTVQKPLVNARFFRRTVFDQIGYFDLGYSVAADRDFLIRAALRQLPDAPVGRVLYRYRWPGEFRNRSGGNATLLIEMKENERIARRYATSQGLGQNDLVSLRMLEETSLVTELMILARTGNWGRATKGLLTMTISRPAFIFVFFRWVVRASFRALTIWTKLRRNL